MRASSFALVFALLAPLAAEAKGAKLDVEPAEPRPGDPVLVRVRGKGLEKAPAGKLGGEALRFVPVRGGWDALAAVPDTAVGEIGLHVKAEEAVDRTLPIAAREPREVPLEVEEIFVEPPEDARARIDADRDAVERAYQQPFVPWTVRSRFTWPSKGKRTAFFGDERTFNGVKNSRHMGVDLAAAKGAPVLAANAGRVVLVRDCFYSGTAVIIHHGGDLYTTYFHLSRANVKPGQEVARGKRIGAAGDTGRTTAPHVHYGVRIGAQYVDPETFMRLPFPSAPKKSTTPAS